MFFSLLKKEDLLKKLSYIRCILLDWDGVFNGGYKLMHGSGFSETDSMGLNLFRYFIFRKNNSLPVCVILSGEKNDTSIYFSSREHLHACYFKVKDKSIALNDIKKRWSLNEEEIIFFFDDVLDLPVARKTGIRAYVHHPSRNKFLDFLKKENLCDIYSDLGGGNNALREIFENLMDLEFDYSSIIISRELYDMQYTNYITLRNSINPEFFILENSEIKKHLSL